MQKNYLNFLRLRWGLPLLLVLLLSDVRLFAAQDPLYAHAQTNPTLSSHSFDDEKSLQHVLNEMQTHFHVSFLYESEVVEGKEVPAEISYNSNVESTLTNLLTPMGLRFKKINKRTYSILPKGPVAKKQRSKEATDAIRANAKVNNIDVSSFSRINLVAQETPDFTVTGKVTDDQGNPIPGANVLIKGTTNGTSTDTNGQYSINVPDENTILVVSFIGYLTQEVAVGSQTVVNVRLTTDIQQLSEVVVVGYGTQKRASVTGAISSVSSEQIAVQPVVNFGQALQGRVAGVSVTNNGAPGKAPIIQIRGVGTVNNTSPLYVVDGFPTSDISAFNAKDIESIEVLKDASAAAIYGSRAANGVILITTKRGSNKKLSVNIDSYYGVEQAWRKLDLLNTEQYLAYANDLLTNGGKDIPPRIGSGMDQPIHSGTTQTFAQTETDWQEEMFRTAPIQQHKIDLSGGSENSKVYTSFGYLSQDGIMIGTGYERADARLNTDHNLSKRITIGQSFYVAYDQTQNERGTGSGDRTQIMHTVRSAPYFPVHNPDNFGGYFGANVSDGSDPENPVRIANMDKQNIERMKLLANVYVDVKLFDFLSYRFQGGVDYVDLTQRTHLPAFVTGGYANRDNAQLEQRREDFISTILTNQLNFNKSFDKHTVNATLVAEQQVSKFSQITGSGSNELSNEIKEPQALAAVGFAGERTEAVLISYIGRVNYDFADKYLLGVSFRTDGSSKFADGKKWGNFPAVSVGWRISEEAFMQNTAFVSELKLRASYGVTGNNRINDYGFLPTLSGSQIYQFDISSSVHSGGYTLRKLANHDLAWETTYMTNIGFDLGVLNDQVTLTAEYFNNETRDMLLERPIAPSMGYDTRPTMNVGSVRNRGIELQLGYNKMAGDFTFNATANVSVIRNKVLDLGDKGTTFSSGDWYGDFLTLTEVGSPIGYFNGFVTDGLFQDMNEVNAHVDEDGNLLQPDAAPGDIRFKDVNNDGDLNADDKQNIGHFLPNFSYGFTFSGAYKGFDASIFFQGVQGNEIYSVTKYDLEGMTRLFNSGTAVLDRWSPDNRNTSIPRAVDQDPNKNARASDRFVEDGSYLRLKNLTLGYSLPSAILSAVGKDYITKVRVYFTSQNLLTFTKYKSGYDPEIGNRNVDRNGSPAGGLGVDNTLVSGIDYGQYPQARSFVLGVQVGF